MKQNKKGFTIVELIIVIAVIGVLAAILIPTFANVISKANQKSALSDAKNALTVCIERFATENSFPVPDLLIFAVKGNKVYVSAYNERFDKLVVFGTIYDRNDATPLSAQVDEIVDLMTAAGYVSDANYPAGTQVAYDTLIADLHTSTLLIRVNKLVADTFVGAETAQTSGGTPTDAPGEPTSEPTTEPTTEPTSAPTGITLSFAAGADAANGGGVQIGTLPEDQLVTSGSFATIPDDIIPRSASLVAGATDAYAFTSYLGSNGNTYYPGDAIVMSENLTLTAQWEGGFTALGATDDITQPFDNLAGKYIMCADIAVWYNNSSYMFPIGFDVDNYSFSTFTGKFDGAGYTLSNLTCSYTGSAIPSALFYANSGTISNLKLQVNSIITKSSAAGVVCTNNDSGVVRNVDVTYGNRSNYYYSASYGDIYTAGTGSSMYLGGVASLNKGVISGCNVLGLVINSPDRSTGGIVGKNDTTGTVEKCSAASITIKQTGSFGEGLGGIVGLNNGNVKMCTSTGLTQTGGSYLQEIGGLVGQHSAGLIENCYVDWSNNTQANNFNVNTHADLGNIYGIIAGSCSSGAQVKGCIGVGSSNTDYAHTPFSTYILVSNSYTATTVQNSYIVGDDPNTIFTEITNVQDRSFFTGLDMAVWDLSGTTPIIPACN